MTATTETLEREAKLQGMGSSRLRKEDARFIRGKGTYVDDIKLPGMLFGAMVRSPYAHARIKSINKAKALAVPGVVAVLVADDLKPVKLDWMPTIGGDVQAVLADKKVCFQMQEVAMVIARDRYCAADGADAVEVDYEELPAIVDPHKAWLPTPRSFAKILPARTKSVTASVLTRITSSPGKRATRPAPMRPLPVRR
jgi:aerobic carbon-monoxide dehydrogenase large subunit